MSLFRTFGFLAFLGLTFAPAVSGQDRTQPSSTAAGETLSAPQVKTLLDKVKAALDAKGMPSNWIDELQAGLPGVKFSGDLGRDNLALYWPIWNTVYLKAGMDLNNLTSQQVATIAHEFWHAWFDFIPTWPFGPISGFSDAQDEAIGGFIDELLGGGNMAAAVGRAISEATGMDRGGTAQQAVDAIIALEGHWDGSFFSNSFPNASALNAWVTARRVQPEIQSLEALFSDADRARIQKRVDELAQAANAPPETTPVATTPTGAPGTGATPSTTPATSAGSGAAGGAPPSPGTTSTGTTPAPGPTPGTGGQPTTVPPPVCDPCKPLAAEVTKAEARLEELQTESAKLDARLGALREVDLPNAQKELEALSAEYDRRLGDPNADDIARKGTFIDDGTQEVRYQEAGGQVNIVTVRNGKTVSGSGHRSPSMTNLMARRDAAKARLERLQADAANLGARRKELDGDLAKAREAVEAARRALEECLKRCGYGGTVDRYLQMGKSPIGSSTGSLFRSGAHVAMGRNWFDRISPTGFSAVGPDGVPYSIAHPGLPADDRYQLFIVMSGQVRSAPPARPPLRMGAIVPERPRLAGFARHVGEGLMAALGLTTPRRNVHLASANRLAPGTLVRVAAAQQAAAAPGVTVVATGSSSGPAFTLEVLGRAGEPVQVRAPDGLVLQPVRQGNAPRPAGAGSGRLSALLTGFCLDYGKPPPPAGVTYQVAPESLQQRHRALRSILRAGRALKDAGLLNPDSDPESYATFVQQWALWTRLEGWNFSQFTNQFLAYTRRNVESSGARWTDVMRDGIRDAARNRFDDILAVLLEAESN
ncbi:MAG: hypothetical protein IT176_02670 [Acidobacteria bacterium]|nr:hypothetical protein [Acidobacteriota bacterium]